MSKDKARKEVSRRDFLKGAVIGAGVAALAGLGPAEMEALPHTQVPRKWDYDADIVVIGTGLAGLSTAITAYDEGAKVFILEKMPQRFEGGTSKVSGNLWWAPTNLPDGIAHIRALCYGTTDEDSIEALAEGMFQNTDWVRELGGDPVVIQRPPRWPELPGSSSVRLYGIKGTVGGGLLWQLLRENVERRGIEVIYELPAQELIQIPETKAVAGVKGVRAAEEIYIKARKGVVLACGGFEFDFEMQRNYQPAWPFYSTGTPANTGDGIKMAEKAGASLWHMNDPSCGEPPFCLLVPEFDPIPIRITWPGMSYIWVNKRGKRFANEQMESRYGMGGLKDAICAFALHENEHLNIPCFGIFDEALRLKGPLLPPLKFSWFSWYSGHAWSKDNSTEIAKGWISKADSIPELAAKMGVNPSLLQDTITNYNQGCKMGKDPDFGRPAKDLLPIMGPPFYAGKLWPHLYSTRGGPKRNKHCQVLDYEGKPIPRLYSAGECGSFWGWMYQGGSLLAECMATGRIAGRSAAAEKTWET